MMNPLELLDETLQGLKDFQSDTVRSVLRNYRSNGGSGRVLVADEVGLGKTIVAKGVIAELLKKSIENKSIKPLRVTYICSNLTLAAENRLKLAVFRGDAQNKFVQEPSYSRLLESAVKENVSGEKDKILEVCSLTPSTSFNLTRGHGYWKERLIIYFALIDNSEFARYKRKLSNLFSNNVNDWQYHKKKFNTENLDKSILCEFHALLRQKVSSKDLQDCEIEFEHGSWLEIFLAFCCGELKFKYKSRVRACIRFLMAKACAKNLTADLFILDEFQRFKVLLDTKNDNEESFVAREIFNNNQKTKILLLSATPFKALSQIDEDEKGNAHKEELNYLLNFISNSDEAKLQEYEKYRKAIQQQVLSLKDETVTSNTISNKNKIAVESILKKYICRTERVQISDFYEDLFLSSAEKCADLFSRNEIGVFKAIDQLGLALQEAHNGRSPGQLIEFYKAAPWPLSFLSGYQFKVNLDTYRTEKNVKGPLYRSDAAWLSYNEVQNYKMNLANAPHAKTRTLVKKIFETHSEELLWVPPAMPHYPLQGSFENQDDFSKTLLFSSWAMVPRALSGLISYEAERRLLLNRRGVKKEYFKEKQHSPKIKFDSKTSLAGWSLVYPAKILVDMSIESETGSQSDLIAKRTDTFKSLLDTLSDYEQGSKKRDLWYALAPMLLDYENGHKQYTDTWLNRILKEREQKGLNEQLERIREFFQSGKNLSLGPMPDDLPEYLAYLSTAGPAVSVARSWKQNWPKETDADISEAASKATFAIIAMFNKPESEGILRKRYGKQKYFQSIARYCADGDFQAVMNEYGHLLKGAGLPMLSRSKNDNGSATTRLEEVMGFRTSNVSCQYRKDRRKSSKRTTDKAGKENNRHSLRCHYAVPLGNQKISDEQGVQRVGNVRDAFNSPFRPFVLNSTSIGQEGLDFHWYCHRVVHWNLPHNPIDIEQREGRVNRYKSLVVRKRVAQKYRQLAEDKKGEISDSWEKIFQIVDEHTQKNRKSDLIPYWHFPEGNAKIERFVPLMPLSKDIVKYENALEILALYRLAFGQPRQEELLENLLKRQFSEMEIKQITEALVINLSPLALNKNGNSTETLRVNEVESEYV